MGFTFDDAERLQSLAWNNDILLDKKRRWLMGPPVSFTSAGNKKKRKRPKFLKELYLPESFVREATSSSSDIKVSNDMVISTVQRSCGLFCDYQAYLHVNQASPLADAQKMDIEFISASNLEKLLLLIGDLNSDALCKVVRILSCERGILNKSRSKMVIVNDLLPKFLEDANAHDKPILKQLLNILRRQSSFKVKKFSVNTSVSQSSISFIHRILEGLHEMPFQEIDAMNRRLRGVVRVLKFPPVRSTYTKGILISRVKRKYERYHSELVERDNLPEPLAKAFLIFHLSFQYRQKSFKPLPSELYIFPLEILSFQNDIIAALWLLENVNYGDLKALKTLLDPNGKICSKRFRKVIKKYLLEYLFESTEICMTKEVIMILDFLNKHSLPKEEREKEVEAVMVISCQLKQNLSSFLLDNSIRNVNEVEISEGREYGKDTYNEAFDASTSEFSVAPGLDNSQLHGSGANFEATVDESFGGDAKGHIEFDCCGDKWTMESSNQQSDSEVTMEKNESLVQIACNEAALVSYKLIGCILEKLLAYEDEAVKKTSISYPHGKKPPPTYFSDDDLTHISEDDLRIRALNESIKELIPSLHTRSMKKVKNVMEMAPGSA